MPHVESGGDALVLTTTAATATKNATWRLWVASSDGRLRTYRVEQPSLQNKVAALDASAARLQLTLVLFGDGDNQLEGEGIHQEDDIEETTHRRKGRKSLL
jgi:hypothetical protein